MPCEIPRCPAEHVRLRARQEGLLPAQKRAWPQKVLVGNEYLRVQPLVMLFHLGGLPRKRDYTPPPKDGHQGP
jgi:hypothetical protein